VHADLREAIAELRRLAHGIHPAELSRRGLTKKFESSSTLIL
jgi:signal transduction histidine kinase